MENKINIAEILSDMPEGTKLYSPLFGKCEYIVVVDNKYPIAIKVQRADGATSKFLMKDGRYFGGYEDTECLLFPSAKMRCWDKFFKHGDIVYNPRSQMYAVFECWANGDYTEFNTTINYYDDHTFGEGEVCATDCFVKATDKQRVEFIEAAEKRYGGKYNPETLQVDPVKVVEHKCPFEPFQEVLVRDSDASIWKAAHFSHYDGEDKYPYITTENAYKQCVPYDCNEYLLGTDKSPE